MSGATDLKSKAVIAHAAINGFAPSLGGPQSKSALGSTILIGTLLGSSNSPHSTWVGSMDELVFAYWR
jgi:hypothetical protein